MKRLFSIVICFCLMVSILAVKSEIVAEAYSFDFGKRVNMGYSGVLYNSDLGDRNCELSIYHIGTGTVL